VFRFFNLFLKKPNSVKNKIILSTPKGELIYELASFRQRLTAVLIDVLPLLMLSFYFPPWLPAWLYFAFLQSRQSQATLGQKIIGIQLMDLRGRKISFWQATGRFLAQFLSGAILFMGYFMMLFNLKNQCLHDSLSNCVVVISQKKQPDDVDEISRHLVN
jgi:uncharacterized RDD family membrane protein YckC